MPIDKKAEHQRLLSEIKTAQMKNQEQRVHVERDMNAIRDMVERMQKKAKRHEMVTPEETNVLTMYIKQSVDGHNVTVAGFDLVYALLNELVTLLSID